MRSGPDSRQGRSADLGSSQRLIGVPTETMVAAAKLTG